MVWNSISCCQWCQNSCGGGGRMGATIPLPSSPRNLRRPIGSKTQSIMGRSLSADRPSTLQNHTTSLTGVSLPPFSKIWVKKSDRETGALCGLLELSPMTRAPCWMVIRCCMNLDTMFGPQLVRRRAEYYCRHFVRNIVGDCTTFKTEFFEIIWVHPTGEVWSPDRLERRHL